METKIWYMVKPTNYLLGRDYPMSLTRYPHWYQISRSFVDKKMTKYVMVVWFAM